MVEQQPLNPTVRNAKSTIAQSVILHDFMRFSLIYVRILGTGGTASFAANPLGVGSMSELVRYVQGSFEVKNICGRPVARDGANG
jgi:hypothetical protein